MKVVIYKPSRSAMQSGTANTRGWILRTLPTDINQHAVFIEPLMGWTASKDTTRQVFLTFPSREAAIEYATHHGLSYTILPESAPKHVIKPYAKKFE